MRKAMHSSGVFDTAPRWTAPVLLLVVFGAVALALLGGGLGHRALGRSIQLAAGSACPNCGRCLDQDAHLAGKAAYENEVAEVMAKNVGVRFRLVARWPVRCRATRVATDRGPSRWENA